MGNKPKSNYWRIQLKGMKIAATLVAMIWAGLMFYLSFFRYRPDMADLLLLVEALEDAQLLEDVSIYFKVGQVAIWTAAVASALVLVGAILSFFTKWGPRSIITSMVVLALSFVLLQWSFNAAFDSIDSSASINLALFLGLPSGLCTLYLGIPVLVLARIKKKAGAEGTSQSSQPQSPGDGESWDQSQGSDANSFGWNSEPSSTPSSGAPPKTCHNCHQPAPYFPDYQAHWCENCQLYV